MIDGENEHAIPDPRLDPDEPSWRHPGHDRAHRGDHEFWYEAGRQQGLRQGVNYTLLAMLGFAAFMALVRWAWKGW